MNGDADLPHRSSSPLKRRASSMDPEVDADTNTNGSNHGAGNQVANGLPRAMSVDPPDTNGAAANGFTNGQSSERPSIQVRVKTIETLLKASKELPLRDGDKAYLVSRSWVDKALTLGADSKLATEATDAEVLGPVDNADIIEEILIDSSGFEYIRLKPGSGLESFELFTEDCWNLVIGWYGLKDGQKPIVRSVINSAPDPQSEAEYMYELHLPIFRVHRLWSEISPLPIEQTLKAKNPPPLTLVRSRKAHAQTFLKDIKTLAGIPFERKVRVFSVPQILPAAEPVQQSLANALTPPDSPEREGANGAQDPWAHLLLSTVAFADTKDVRIKVPIEDHTGNEKYNGSTTLRVFDLVTDQTLVVDESIDKFWVSTYDGKKAARITSVKDTASGLSSKTNSRRNSPNPQGPITRGRGQQKRGRSLGAVGLHNLGNTCYMNSALQCVRSVEELTKYFLTDSYIDEINKGNPLGYNGRVATAYVSLLKEIYAEGRGSVSPREFKTTVGRCRSTFQGWGQQDSQEFLGFLLDGLQEDLSRIKKKPYIEKPDSTDDMINDPEAIRKMAEEVWDITRRRDDSVIADLFTGMYKSTLKCPVCGKISITFDPFNNLTLPLPVEDMWIKTVKFFPLNDVPVKIEVELPKHSALEQLKQFVSDRTGVPLERLMGAEEFKDRFFKIYDNNHDISEEIQSSDIPTIHELESVPTNWPSAPRRKKYRSMLDVDTPLEVTEWDDPKYERMVVPVFHRRPNLSRGSDNASPPHFIMLTKEEASNYDLIVRKVLERVATFSSWSKLAEAAEPDNTNNGDSDVVIVASDADSSGDSKVAADSVKGEEDLVDVTMKDASDKPATLPPQSKILKQFNTKRPAFANPEVPIHPELQSLFDLSYFTDSSEGTVPTGWSQVDNTRQLPKLSDRIQSAAEEDEPSPGESWGSTASGDGESSNEDAPKVDAEQTRMLDESSEEDDSTAARFSRRPDPRGGAGGRKKFRDRKQHGKKGNKRRERQMRANKDTHRAAAIKPQPMPPAVADGGPLIRLGEGLVVDWNEEAWEMVFGQNTFDRDTEKGARTYLDLETLHDTALKNNQRRRQHRRSRGITLEECLDEFERAEVLSEQDMWYCPRCKEHRRASKKFDLWKTPDILVAHLKRFSSSGYRRDKLDVMVDFPTEGLDLTERVIQKEDGQDEIYDLIGVDDHYGGLGGGHYTAYAKNFMDGRWYNYNDSSVSQVSDPSSVVTSAAYLLFYRRRSSAPLGGPRFREIFDKFDNPNDDDDDDDSATESGDDQRQGGGGFFLNGSSNGGIGAGAARLQTERGSKTTVTPVADLDDDEPPSYGSGDGGSTVQLSIEDEGVEMSDNFNSQHSNPLTQAWSFDGVTSNARAGSTGAEYASDDAQLNSSDEERGRGKELYDQDIDMVSNVADAESDAGGPPPPDDNAQIALSDIQNEAWERKGVLSVPAKAGSDRDSDEVAEIHVEGDKTARPE